MLQRRPLLPLQFGDDIGGLPPTGSGAVTDPRRPRRVGDGPSSRQRRRERRPTGAISCHRVSIVPRRRGEGAPPCPQRSPTTHAMRLSRRRSLDAPAGASSPNGDGSITRGHVRHRTSALRGVTRQRDRWRLHGRDGRRMDRDTLDARQRAGRIPHRQPAHAADPLRGRRAWNGALVDSRLGLCGRIVDYRDVVRAKIVLMAADGLDNDEIADRLDTDARSCRSGANGSSSRASRASRSAPEAVGPSLSPLRSSSPSRRWPASCPPASACRCRVCTYRTSSPRCARRGIVAEVSGTTIWRWLSEDAIRPVAATLVDLPPRPRLRGQGGPSARSLRRLLGPARRWANATT